MRRSVLNFLRKTGLKIPDNAEALKALLNASNLTEPQLEALLVELAAAASGQRLSFDEKARIRRVSKGAYARTLKQAVENIKKSIYTIFLLRYLGVLGDGAVSSLLEAADLLGQGRVEESMKLISDVMLRDITA
ncbi:MAG: hypothetical protein J7J94_00130 [Thaumarchaeota archaeon]|nr:hypothetical protein [Nitrososphaerota archaeon]